MVEGPVIAVIGAGDDGFLIYKIAERSTPMASAEMGL